MGVPTSWYVRYPLAGIVSRRKFSTGAGRPLAGPDEAVLGVGSEASMQPLCNPLLRKPPASEPEKRAELTVQSSRQPWCPRGTRVSLNFLALMWLLRSAADDHGDGLYALPVGGR